MSDKSQLKQEFAQAAVNGIAEYLRSTRGAHAFGAGADVELVGDDTIQIVNARISGDQLLGELRIVVK